MNEIELLNRLNRAYIGEVVAEVQYNMLARLLRLSGHKEDYKLIRAVVIKDEVDHADILAKHIVKMGGVLPTDLMEFTILSGCKFTPPSQWESNLRWMLSSIDSEDCAVKDYTEIMSQIKNGNKLYQDLNEIRGDEIKHSNIFLEMKKRLENDLP